MLNRKNAVSMAIVAAVTATASTVLADTTTPTLSLEPTVATMDDAAAAPVARRPLMAGLDKLVRPACWNKYNINIYGWVEGSYTYNHRHLNRDTATDTSATIPPNKVGVAGNLPLQPRSRR